MRSTARRIAQLAGLSAFAFAQPTLDVLAKHPTYFVAHDLSRAEIVVFAFALVVVPTLLLVALFELLARFSSSLANGVEAIVVGVLAALALLPLVDLAGVRSVGAVTAAGVTVAAAIALVHATFPIWRSFLTVVAPLGLVAPVLFLTSAGIRPLLAEQPVAISGAVVRNPAPIVVVVFDGLRLVELLDEKGEVDAARFPSFAQLAKTSTWYRNATTVATFTHEAVPAILTGRYPKSATASSPSAVEHPESLFTLLGGAYRLIVDEPVTAVCPTALCDAGAANAAKVSLPLLASDTAIVWMHVALPRALRKNLPSLAAKWSGFGDKPHYATGVGRKPRQFEEAIEGEDRRDAFLRFLDRLTSDRRALSFHHTLLPHNPFEYLPSGAPNGVPSQRLRTTSAQYTWTKDPRGVRFEEGLYVLQLAYTDALLGLLLERLEELGIADDAVLVITADHGFSFVAGESQRHAHVATSGDVVPVPLFIKRPGQRAGEVSDANVETIDILPTVASLIGVEIPWALDGHAIGSGDARRAKSVFQNNVAAPLALADVVRARDESLRAKLASVGSGGVAYDVLHSGTAPRTRAELVSALAAPAPPAFVVELGRSGRFVDGSLIGARPPGADDVVVVAADGNVAATVEPFASEVTQYYAFEALLDERSVKEGTFTPEIFLWDAEAGTLSRPLVAPAPEANETATTRLWRSVWAGSDRGFTCGRRVRDAFATRYAETKSNGGAIGAEALVAAAVVDCYDALDDGRRQAGDLECGCGAFATRSAARVAIEGSGGGADDGLWETVWRGTEIANECSADVRRRFEELHRLLRASNGDMPLAPYEILAAAARSCFLETKSADTLGRECSCGRFDPASAPDNGAMTPWFGGIDAASVRKALLRNHLKRNGLL